MVDDTGAGDYTTIQGAVDAASPFDTILIAPRSSSSFGWQEAVVVDTDDLTICGEEAVEECTDVFCWLWRFLVHLFHKLTFGLFRTETTKTTSSRLSEFDTASLVAGKVTEESTLALSSCSPTILDGGDGVDNTLKDIITVTAERVTIKNLRFRHGQIVFTSGSDDSTLRDNCFFQTERRMVRTEDAVSATRIRITDNIFFNGIDYSIDLACDGCTISENTILPCDNGIRVMG